MRWALQAGIIELGYAKKIELKLGSNSRAELVYTKARAGRLGCGASLAPSPPIWIFRFFN